MPNVADVEQTVVLLEYRYAQFDRECGGAILRQHEHWRECAGYHTALLSAVKDALLQTYALGSPRPPDLQLSKRLIDLRDTLEKLEPLYKSRD